MAINLNYKFILSIGSALAFITCLTSGLVSWLIWQNSALVPLWGSESASTYHLISSFFYSLILSLFSTWATRRAIKNRKVVPLHWHLKSQTLIDRLPSTALHRGVILGMAGALMAAISLLLFSLQNVQALPLNEFIIFKSIFGALLAAAVSVMAIYRALGDKTISHSSL